MAKPTRDKSGTIPTAETLEKATAETTAVTKTRGPSTAMMSVLSARENVKVRRLTLPLIIPPAKVGLGVSVEGTVIRVVPSPVALYKSDLLVMKHPSGQEFCFPATAVIIGALAAEQGVSRDKVDLKKTVGLSLLIKGLGPKDLEGKDSAGRQRIVNLYEVFVIEK